MLAFLLGAAFGIVLTVAAAGLLIVALDRGWLRPWWRGF